PFSFSTTPATPVFSPLSLHDALPIFYFSPVETQQAATIQTKPHPAIRILHHSHHAVQVRVAGGRKRCDLAAFKFGEAAISSGPEDRKSTRLNSSHVKISYAVFCLKKK